MAMRERFWRLRCAYWFWDRLRCPLRFAFESSQAIEYWPDWSPQDSVDEELSYWTE